MCIYLLEVGEGVDLLFKKMFGELRVLESEFETLTMLSNHAI